LGRRRLIGLGEGIVVVAGWIGEGFGWSLGGGGIGCGLLLMGRIPWRGIGG